MAAPAFLKVAARAAAASSAGRRRRGAGLLVWLAAALVLLPLFVAAPFLAVQAGQPPACGTTAPGASWEGPGSLGGFQGTGLTAADMRRLGGGRGGGRLRLAPAKAGSYTATAYAPALGGINVWQGGLVTAGGIRVDAGERRAYIVAVDPNVIPLGTLLWVSPNPYRWAGPFVAADTGGAILDRRIDIYVFGDRDTAAAKATSWGKRTVKISSRPIHPGGPPASAPGATAPDCAAGGLGGGNGRWTLTSYANRAGVGLTADMRRFMDKLASFLPRRVIVCTATNHSKYTLSGNVSDHWSGNAVDICSSENGFPSSGGGYGGRIAAAAFRVAGYGRSAAATASRAGGAQTITAGGLRVQIIWRTQVGGNHYDHVHVGIAPL